MSINSYFYNDTEILEGPETQVVSSDESSVTFNCRIRGETLEWTTNGRLSDPTENIRLIGLGVEFNKSPRLNGKINASITFPNIPHFNSTRVICVSLNATGTSQSSEAVMITAGMYLRKLYWIVITPSRSPTPSCPSTEGVECHVSESVMGGAIHMGPLPSPQLSGLRLQCLQWNIHQYLHSEWEPEVSSCNCRILLCPGSPSNCIKQGGNECSRNHHCRNPRRK